MRIPAVVSSTMRRASQFVAGGGGGGSSVGGDDDATETAMRRLGDRMTHKKNLEYACRRSGAATAAFNGLRVACAKFGFYNGDRVLIRSGKHAGREATIIGVRHGWLWRHQDGNGGATAFFASSQRELAERYDLLMILDGSKIETIRQLSEGDKHLLHTQVRRMLAPLQAPDAAQATPRRRGWTGERVDDVPVLFSQGFAAVVFGEIGRLWARHAEAKAVVDPAAVAQQTDEQRAETARDVFVELLGCLRLTPPHLYPSDKPPPPHPAAILYEAFLAVEDVKMTPDPADLMAPRPPKMYPQNHDFIPLLLLLLLAAPDDVDKLLLLPQQDSGGGGVGGGGGGWLGLLGHAHRLPAPTAAPAPPLSQLAPLRVPSGVAVLGGGGPPSPQGSSAAATPTARQQRAAGMSRRRSRRAVRGGAPRKGAGGGRRRSRALRGDEDEDDGDGGDDGPQQQAPAATAAASRARNVHFVGALEGVGRTLCELEERVTALRDKAAGGRLAEEEKQASAHAEKVRAVVQPVFKILGFFTVNPSHRVWELPAFDREDLAAQYCVAPEALAGFRALEAGRWLCLPAPVPATLSPYPIHPSSNLLLVLKGKIAGSVLSDALGDNCSGIDVVVAPLSCWCVVSAREVPADSLSRGRSSNSRKAAAAAAAASKQAPPPSPSSPAEAAQLTPSSPRRMVTVVRLVQRPRPAEAMAAHATHLTMLNLVNAAMARLKQLRPKYRFTTVAQKASKQVCQVKVTNRSETAAARAIQRVFPMFSEMAAQGGAKPAGTAEAGVVSRLKQQTEPRQRGEVAYYLPGAGTYFFQASEEACKAAGFFSGQRLMYTKGAKAGRATTVVGVWGGKLWHHEDDEDPRPFQQGTLEGLQKACRFAVLGWDELHCKKQSMCFSETVVSTDDADLEAFGQHHNEVVTHASGPLRGCAAVVLGVTREGLLCKQLLEEGLFVKETLSSAAQHAVQHRHTLNYCLLRANWAARPEQPHLLSPASLALGIKLPAVKAAPTEVLCKTRGDGVVPVDTRVSHTMEHGAMHGQSILVVVGRCLGCVGRVLGVRRGRLHALMLTGPDKDLAMPLEERSFVVIASPLHPVTSPYKAVSTHPRYVAACRLATANRRIEARQRERLEQYRVAVQQHQESLRSKVLIGNSSAAAATAQQQQQPPQKRPDSDGGFDSDASGRTPREGAAAAQAEAEGEGEGDVAGDDGNQARVACLSCLGEVLDFDTSFASCNVFRLYPRQVVSWHDASGPARRDRVARCLSADGVLTAGADAVGGGDEALAASLSHLDSPEPPTTSTIVGVWLGELWRVDAGCHAAAPFRGSSFEELATRYRVRVVGRARGPPGTLRFALLPKGARMAATWRHDTFRLPHVAAGRLEGGEVVGLDTRAERVRAVDGRMASGTRVIKLRRMERPRMVTREGDGGAAHLVSRWYEWYERSTETTVVGVYDGVLYTHEDGAACVAPLTMRDLASCRIVSSGTGGRPHALAAAASASDAAPATGIGSPAAGGGGGGGGVGDILSPAADAVDSQAAQLAAAASAAAAAAAAAAGGRAKDGESRDSLGVGVPAAAAAVLAEVAGEGSGDASRGRARPTGAWGRRGPLQEDEDAAAAAAGQPRFEEREVGRRLGAVTEVQRAEMAKRFALVPLWLRPRVLRWVVGRYVLTPLAAEAGPPAGAGSVDEEEGRLLGQLVALEAFCGVAAVAAPPLRVYFASELRRLASLEEDNRRTVSLQCSGALKAAEELFAQEHAWQLYRVRAAAEKQAEQASAAARRKRVAGTALGCKAAAGAALRAEAAAASGGTPEGDPLGLSLSVSVALSRMLGVARRRRGDRETQGGGGPPAAFTIGAPPAAAAQPRKGLTAQDYVGALDSLASEDGEDAARGEAAAAASAAAAAAEPLPQSPLLGASGRFDGGSGGVGGGPAAGDGVFVYRRACGVLRVDASEAACVEGFGVASGTLLRRTRGDLKGTACVVVGLSGGRLWRYELDHPLKQGLHPFEGATFADVQALHRFECVREAVPVPTADPFLFVTNQGLLKYFDVSEEACGRHGVRHGERYHSRRGKLKGQVIVVVGVCDDALWVAVDWSGAFLLQYSSDYTAELGLTPLMHAVVSPWTPAAPCFLFQGRNYDVSERGMARHGVQFGQRVGVTARRLVGTVVGVRRGHVCVLSDLEKSIAYLEVGDRTHDLNQPNRRGFLQADDAQARQVGQYESDHGRSFWFRSCSEICSFDTRPQSLGAFGVQHGQVIRLTRKGKAPVESVVLGVRNGLLWRLEGGKGTGAATACNGVRDAADLHSHFGLQVVGTLATIAEFTG